MTRFADESPAGLAAVEEDKSDELAEDSEGENKRRGFKRPNDLH